MSLSISVDFPSKVFTEVKHGVYKASGPVPYMVHLETVGIRGNGRSYTFFHLCILSEYIFNSSN